ncbi:MAG: tetratricopeptide repeat protein [Planctomycetes bacterium]|nr:tetratricopeptide repeat protein [Planctomycetota bacterium]
MLLDAGRHDDAEQAYRTAIRLQETLINQRPNEHKYQQSLSVCWNSLGNLYKHTGRYEQAESAYEQALTLADALVRAEPDNVDHARRLAESSHNLGNLMRDTGRPAEAIPVYRQALQALDGRLESASSRELVPLRLVLGDVRNSLGASFWDSRRLNEAEEAFRQAVSYVEELVADFPRVPDYRELLAMRLSNLGSVLHEQKRFDECEEPLRLAVEIRGKLVADFPDLPKFRFGLAAAQMNIGVIYEDAKRFVEAEKSTRDAMERLSALAADFPEVPIYARSHANCLYNLGDIMMVTDRTAEAEPFFVEAIDIYSALASGYPDVPAYREELFDTHRRLGEMHKALGRLERAEVEFDAALEAAATLPDGPRTQTPRFHHNLGHAWAALAYIYTDSARLDEALEAHHKALELRIPLAEEFPDDSHKQWDATVTSIHRAALLMINMKRPAEAEPDLRRAIGIAEVAVQQFPDNLDHLDHLASATSALGQLRFGQGRMSEAEEPTRRAQALLGELMEKRPDSPRYRRPYFATYSGLATILSRTGRPEEAAATFRNAVERWPDEPGMLNGHAWFLVTVEAPQLRDAQRAVELARRASTLDPESGKYLGTLGVTLYRSGNNADAIETLTKANALKDGGDAYNFFVLAMAHEKLGDSDTAREWFDRGVTWMTENKPDNEELHRFHAEAAAVLDASNETRDPAPDAQADAINDAARRLLTIEPADLRDPQAALEFARRANDLTNYDHSLYLNTLALAYYMTGNMARALETQQEALSLLTEDQESYRPEMEANLTKYKAALEQGAEDER